MIALSAPDRGFCQYRTQAFTAFFKGDRISGILTSNKSIDFIMMSEQNYLKWNAAHTCAVESFNPLIYVETLSYSLDMVLPAADEYRFIFMNHFSSVGIFPRA